MSDENGNPASGNFLAKQLSDLVERDGEPVRCITAFVVYMELDGHVVCTPQLGDVYLRLRPAELSDMVTCLGRAKVEVDAQLAFEVFQAAADRDLAEQRDRTREASQT